MTAWTAPRADWYRFTRAIHIEGSSEEERHSVEFDMERRFFMVDGSAVEIAPLDIDSAQ